jgi:nicotinate-nucleotide pyrophosphorylase (carboxylating)
MIHAINYLNENQLTGIIKNALSEDISTGDVTSNSILEKNQTITATLIAKQNLILSGLKVFEQTFKVVNPDVTCTFNFSDGSAVENKALIGKIRGPIISVLSAERTALNFLQRMSGIASLTRQYVDQVKGTKAIILDTRKTAPGLRMLDKWAVKTGGGQNHRIGLFDMILIKENHISGIGSISKAIQKVLNTYDQKFEIEVEVKNLEELAEALQHPLKRILLDNMSLNEMTEAVHIANGKIPLEASGNVNLESVKAIADTGVDYISVGSLTHSVQAADLSLVI